jgi:WD40 repeat protein
MKIIKDKPNDARPIVKSVDPTKTRQVQELKHNSPLIGCRIDPSGRFVFASAQDSKIVSWELAGGKKTELIGHKSWVRGLAFLASERLLFTGDYTGRVHCWPLDADQPTPRWTIQAHEGWCRAVAVSPDGKLLATCGNDQLVKLWSLTDQKLIREFTGHASHVYNVAFHPGGQFLVSGDLMGVLKQWDVNTGTAVRDMDAGVLHKYDTVFCADIGGIRSMAFRADGNLLACAGITDVSNAFAGVGKPIVLLFDWQTGKRTQGLVPKVNYQGTAWGVGFHPAGFIVGAGGGNGGALWFWKPEAPQAFHTLSLPNNARDLSLHPEGKRLAVAFADGSVRIYDMTG